MSDSLSPPVFTYRRRIDFADTDVGGIVHFSRFLVFMETAEHEMLRDRGINVHFEHEGTVIGWPRVEVTCRYLKPARFGDAVEVEVRVRRCGQRSMTYDFRILRQEHLLAEGQMTSVCCVLHADRPPEAITIPHVIADKLPGEKP
ncbi:MAG: acyl-CoA thioesterase [Acidobacteriota bacterium]|nr:acyl-CoA thioesterase [Acidobacteriota bacterium]